MSMHINAKRGDFAKVVLMPGDPLRAKWIAETYLKNVREVTNVRNILGYTGYTKNNKRISVMASGMGQPSIGIYSHELFAEYNVELIIRVGTCGCFSNDVNLSDIVVANAASSDYNWFKEMPISGNFSAGASYDVLEEFVNQARKRKKKIFVGNTLSEGTFYHINPDWWKPWRDIGVIATEMETYALYCNASILRKKALGVFTCSDHFQKKKNMTSKERQTGLKEMIELAIATAEKFA